MLFRKLKKRLPFKKALVVVAHPGDETLWAGGTIMMYPEIEWTVLALFGQEDPKRISKFHKAVSRLGAKGIMGHLDEGPENALIDMYELQFAILELLPVNSYDLIVTHGSEAEFIKHRRYEETGQAVASMFKNGMLTADHLWRFAYEEGIGKNLIDPSADADQSFKVSRKVWKCKKNIMARGYGFNDDSLTTKAVPQKEAYGLFLLKDRGA